MIRRSFALLLLLLFARPIYAVAPGGVYRTDNSASVSVDPKYLPHTLGYHRVEGTATYHGRKMPFLCGVFLPPAFVHAKDPMPVLMCLHNRYGIGSDDPNAALGEGMGQMLAYGNADTRAEGDRPLNPIRLRQDAQFIGLVPQCPLGLNWEDPVMAHMLCSFIDQVVAHYHADGDRVYLTGFSYGASSTWRLALNAPDRFAAIIICDGRMTLDPVHDVAKLKNVAIYLEVGQWDGDFVAEADKMHQALDTLPHPNFIFHQIPGGNHFNYQSVYNDPLVWKWVYAQHRVHAAPATQHDHFESSATAR